MRLWQLSLSHKFKLGRGGAVVPSRRSAIAPRQTPARLRTFAGSIPTPGRKLFGSDTFTFYHTNYPIMPTTNPLAPCLKFTPLYLISPSFIWLTATGSHDLPIKFHHCHRNPSVNAVNAGWSPVPGWVPDSGREGWTLACESL
jgi:hypothetical protein